MTEPRCTKCELHTTAKNVCIPGNGPKDAQLMIVGQNPGSQEDRLNQVFIGPSGKDLNEYLDAVGLTRADVYVTNAVKCHTLGNEPPTAKHEKACREHLITEITEIQPKYVVALGNTALKVLTGESGITKKAGDLFPLHAQYANTNTQVLPTFHPAAAMRLPRLQNKINEDFRTAARLIGKLPFTAIDRDWAWAVTQKYPQAINNVVAFDVETEGLNPRNKETTILTCAVSNGEETVVVKDEHDLLQLSKILAERAEHGIMVVGHNSCAFDMEWLIQKHHVSFPCHDTQLMAYILHEEQSLKLENLAVKYLNIEPWKHEVTWKWEQFRATTNAGDWDKLGSYNAHDAKITHALATKLITELRTNGQWQVYDKILRPTAWSVRILQANGMYISRENTRRVRDEFLDERNKYYDELTDIAYKLGFDEFNPNSTNQVKNILYGCLKYPVTRRTKTGEPSTDELTLRIHALKPGVDHTFLHTLLKYRGAAKAISTYLDPYLEMAYAAEDSRIHPEYSITFTDTGRTSARNPNSQNIPRDKRLRSMVSARPGYCRVQADYSQLEMRIMAHLSECPNLLDAFIREQDVHLLMAAEITRKPISHVTKAERSDAKPANFGFLYGAEVPTFNGIMLKDYDKYLTYGEGQKIRDAFFRRWSGLEAYYKRVFEEAREFGYVKSLTGRRRHLQNIYASDPEVRTEALRMGINFTVQSFASDIALVGLNKVRAAGFFITDFVHDSVGMEVPETDDLVAIKHHLEDLMVHGVLEFMYAHFNLVLAVPIKIDVQAGPHWGALEDVK